MVGDSGLCRCVPCYERDVSQAQLSPFVVTALAER